MPIRDDVFAYIQKTGPKTVDELLTKFKLKKASMRRTCNELVHAGLLAPMPSEGRRQYGVSADARVVVAPAVDDATPVAKKKKNEEPPVDTKDWRMTDFTF